MNAVVIVALARLKDVRPDIVNKIKECSDLHTQTADVYMFSPRTGKLFDLLSLLKDNGIPYTTHYDKEASSELSLGEQNS